MPRTGKPTRTATTERATRKAPRRRLLPVGAGTVLSLEDNGSDGYSDPQRQWGVLTAFWSPGTITLRDDNTTYSHSSRHTHRISVCGGSACGSTVSTLEAMIVHRVDTISNLSSATMTPAALYTDSTHYVVQADDKVVGMARGGSLVTGYPAHTVASNTTQAVYLCLASGLYQVTLNATQIQETYVNTGDNSLYVEPTGGGTLVITQVAYVPPSITTASLPDATIGVAYSQTVQGQGGVTPYAWSLSAGALPAGLSLNAATGAITGTASVAGSFSFTVLLTDAEGATASMPLSISVDIFLTLSPTPVSLTATAGGTHPSQSVSISASGISLTNWSVSNAQSWLSLSPLTGSAPGSFIATASCDALGAGTYSDTISAASTTPGITSLPTTIPVSLTCFAAPSITNTVPLGNGTKGSAYGASLTASGGQTPYTWSITGGSLPAGLSLAGSTISGTPTALGVSSFTLHLLDAGGAAATQPTSITVLSPPGGGMVGNPALVNH